MLSPVKLWRNQSYIRDLLGKTGAIVSYTVVRVPPEGFGNQAPYPVVVVDIGKGKRITLQLVDWEAQDLKVGRKVRVVLRRMIEPNNEGLIPYGAKAKPI